MHQRSTLLRHPGAGRGPALVLASVTLLWIPAFAGMTDIGFVLFLFLTFWVVSAKE